MVENLSLDTIRLASINQLERFSLQLSGLEPLVCEQVLRHLPGKRIVFKARWNGSDVLVKLFFNEQDYAREKHGLELLEKYGIPGPARRWVFVGAGADQSDDAYLIATDFFADAESLGFRCQAEVDEVSVSQVLAVIGSMHRAGLVQEDIHLDNFLFSNGQVYIIDGGSVKGYEKPKHDIWAKNLALFFAQFPPQFDEKIPQIFVAYGDPNFWSKKSLKSFLNEVIKKRLWRIRKYQKKSLRSCTEFVADQNWGRFLVLRRDRDNSALRKLLDQPDASFGQGRLIKSGLTATVYEVAGSGGANWVLKRYNIKSWSHGLSRSWRPTRGWTSWRNAHALAIAGVPTPKPVALRESRSGPLRREAYLITEKVEGDVFDQWLLKRPGHDIPSWLDAAILNTFRGLLGARISHGDMKSTNFIVTKTQLVLVDLDVMCVHSSERAFYRAFRKDMKRFMANWHGDTHRHFTQLLSPIFEKIGLQSPELRV